MKKFLAIFFLAVLPLVAFTSCSDDDDDEKKDEPVAASSILGKYFDVEYPTDYIELKEGGVVVEYVYDDGKNEGFTEYGTYVYNAPNISITIPNGDGYSSSTYSGSISGNTMNLNDYGVYVKR